MVAGRAFENLLPYRRLCCRHCFPSIYRPVAASRQMSNVRPDRIRNAEPVLGWRPFPLNAADAAISTFYIETKNARMPKCAGVTVVLPAPSARSSDVWYRPDASAVSADQPQSANLSACIPRRRRSPGTRSFPQSARARRSLRSNCRGAGWNNAAHLPPTVAARTVPPPLPSRRGPPVGGYGGKVGCRNLPAFTATPG